MKCSAFQLLGVGFFVDFFGCIVVVVVFFPHLFVFNLERIEALQKLAEK